jgi:hypothetical protein
MCLIAYPTVCRSERFDVEMHIEQCRGIGAQIAMAQMMQAFPHHEIKGWRCLPFGEGGFDKR